MADDRMKTDDLQRNMGGADKDQNFGQQSPGRGGQGGFGGEQAGQHAGGQHSGGQVGGQKGTRNMEDEDDFGAGQVGTQNRGGSQNRGSQNR
jgi:hypothetical protein